MEVWKLFFWGQLKDWDVFSLKVYIKRKYSHCFQIYSVEGEERNFRWLWKAGSEQVSNARRQNFVQYKEELPNRVGFLSQMFSRTVFFKMVGQMGWRRASSLNGKFNEFFLNLNFIKTKWFLSLLHKMYVFKETCSLMI